MAIQRRSIGYVIAVVAVAALVLPPLLAMPIIYFWTKPTLYRFSFPADRPLEEKDAVELSRQALVLYGKQSTGMHPAPWSGHPDENGRAPLFARRDGYPDDGQILWWIASPEHDWEYSVRVYREGDEVVCEVARPL